MTALLEVENLAKSFQISRKHRVDAVKGVSFRIEEGQTYGLVGESGSGKSTVARMVARLTEPTSGVVRFAGDDVTRLDRAQRQQYRQDVQIVFQDPFGALNPRMTVEELITEPLVVHRRGTASDRRSRARDLVERVGLPVSSLARKPVDFSGGQRQRIMIARALALQPRLIVADEPVSALDVSVQAQVLNLLKDLQEEFGLSYLFISHDLSVVEFISDQIGVMYLGELIEEGAKRDIYANPQQQYTRSLIEAIPTIEGRS
ncbi:ATP-binding cassette domain-containing protein [Microbacterium foliorum]|uniref:ATP-binding cassette domain-containing protein n=1 Tax=Microbacterium foliorum TaxID=104336 RepID=UPI00209F8A02|nr:ATP-binding cassette domain-containing protein [Microbacterium foliorum]MCP1428543.1 ABC-type oligopeptide transport system ATPase subunit [Microbacterium foliorum]